MSKRMSCNFSMHNKNSLCCIHIRQRFNEAQKRILSNRPISVMTIGQYYFKRCIRTIVFKRIAALIVDLLIELIFEFHPG